jgi:hypothetical protein
VSARPTTPSTSLARPAGTEAAAELAVAAVLAELTVVAALAEAIVPVRQLIKWRNH